MLIQQIIYLSVFVALIATFLLLLMGKWGTIEWVQVHGSKLFSDMFSCQFCLSFWISILITFLLLIFITFTNGNISPFYVFIPICATTLIRKLL